MLKGNAQKFQSTCPTRKQSIIAILKGNAKTSQSRRAQSSLMDMWSYDAMPYGTFRFDFDG